MRRKSEFESANEAIERQSDEISPQTCELDIIVRAQKAKIAFSVVAFTVVEVVICLFSIDKLVSGWREDGGEKVNNAGGRSVLMLEKAVIKTDSKEENAGNDGGGGDDDDIDSGIIEVSRRILYKYVYTVYVSLSTVKDLDSIWSQQKPR